MREDVDAIIEAIVDAAQIANRRRRDELRRELRGHFEDSGQTAGALDGAVARFGNIGHIGDALRAVYRRDYVLLYIVKVGLCMAAAGMAAVLIETIASLRVEGHGDLWHLSPHFADAAGFGVVLAVALVAAAEATRAPFTWSRTLWCLGCYAALSVGASTVNADSVSAFVTAGVLATIGVGVARVATAWTSRILLTLTAFAVPEYLLHQSLGIPFGPVRSLTASAVLVVLWASTSAIITFSDRAFVDAFRTT